MVGIKKINIETSKRGLPCVWEQGGGFSNTGDAVIICNSKGGRKKPLYIRQRGDLSCKQHALVVIQKGDIIIEASHHREDFDIYVWRITGLDLALEIANLELINLYSRGEWDDENIECYSDAVDAAVEKATEYHCRRAVYVA